ncbi:DUF4175 family protein, partial [Lutibacter sp.]|uniref:DUF4175 family protein n=1 Tax=Lutibacter sp. TaxID=1925666 RepID=UPI00356B53C2
VIQHSTQFEQPAPFTFVILNKSLKVIEGESFFLEVEAVGMSIPEDVIINLSGESYYLESNGFGKFKYNFSAVKENITFSLNSGNVFSKEYKLSVIPTPVISGLKMELKYPAYTGKSDEVLKNTGNAVVPQGTKVTWRIETEKTEKISIKGFDGEELNFNPISKNLFSFSQNLMSTFKYGISTSNKQIVNHESINFSIDVISDEFPKIFVKSDIDSISHGPVQFIGQLSDDYAIDKLQLVYYNVNQPKLLIKHIIPVTKSSFTDFYYVFPEGLSIQEGVEYEMYFEVFDNDGVNGSKKSKSTVFSYYNKTSNELNDLLLKEQKESLSKISNSVQKSKKASNDLKKLSEELQKKARMNWNDAKKLEEFLKRQNEYEKMIQDQTKDLQNNLKEQPVMESLKKKKKELEKRIEESRKMQEQEKLLEELKELTQKLEKENLVDKLKELTQKNKRNEQSLERILELTKRFYVEQKANQIKEKLEKVSKKEEELSKGELEDNTSKKQDELNKEFDEIENDFTDLNKQNKDLKRPIDLPNLGQERKEVNQLMDDALDKLNNNQKESAKNSQEKAAKKMKKMAESFNSAMEASEGESIDEDIDDLRKIV